MPNVNPNIPQITDTQIARFWDKVIIKGPDDCWIWSARRNSANYGNIHVSGRTLAAHRLSYFLSTGIWSQLYICHKCDNPPCVNPNHLFEGSAFDNAKDTVSKGRARRGNPKTRARGEHHGLSKLTQDDVLAIYASSETNLALANRYSVHHMTIGDIRRGRTWSHITGAQPKSPPQRSSSRKRVANELSFFELLLYLWHEAQSYKVVF